MRLLLEFLGHRLDLRLDHPGDEDEAAPGREAVLDSVTERADPYSPPIGFGPHPRE